MAEPIERPAAYENGDYEATAELFSLAAERKNGQDLETVADLYLTNYKSGRFEEAENTIAKVV